jgi:hypothetical protein
VRRKLVLFLALVAVVGFGFGWITEDMCCLGGSYADDPTTPVVAAEYALPAHSQAAPQAVLPTVTVEAAGLDNLHVRTFSVARDRLPTGLSSLQNPRRC